MSLLVVVILVRLLTPEDFGLVAAFLAVVKLAQAVQGMGLRTALVQRQELDDQHWTTAFWAQLFVAIVLMLALVATAGPIAGLVGERNETGLLVVLSLALPLYGLGLVPEARLLRAMDFRSLSQRTFVASFLAALVGVLTALGGWGAWALVTMEIVRVSAGTALLWKASAWLPRGAAARSSFDQLWGYARSILATDILAVTLRRADDLIIGAILGPVALGFYTVAYRALEASTDLLTRVASAVATPVFSRVQQDRERLREGFYEGVRLVAVVTYPFFVVLGVLAAEMVAVVFGEGWMPAVPVVRYLAGVGLLHSVLFLNTSLLLATGYADVKLKLTIIDIVVTIPAFLVGARWGITGVAVGYLVANVLTTPIEVGAARRYVDISVRRYVAALVRPGVVAALAGVAAFGGSQLFGNTGPAIRLVGAGSVALVLTVLSAGWLMPGIIKDIRQTVRR